MGEMPRILWNAHLIVNRRSSMPSSPAEITSHDYAGFFRDCPVLITGGAGFIGSHLAHRLIQLGAIVHIIDDLSGGFRENIPPAAIFTHGSILDENPLKKAVSGTGTNSGGCRFIFHQAAMVSVPESVEDPRRCANINIIGTELVLEAAKDTGVERVIFAASAAAYGGSPQLPSREDHPPDCQSPYAASKVAGELLLHTFARCYGLSTVSLRYFNIFGPRQNPDSPYAAAISAVLKAARNNKQPTIYGDGKQTRDFTYIDNVVHANLLAASSPRNFTGEVINIGTGKRISLLDVLTEISRALNVNTTPRFAPTRPGDVKDSVADITKARDLLGYQPITDFPSGIKQTLQAYSLQ